MRYDDESHSHCALAGETPTLAFAQAVLKEEARRNPLKHGEVVLVDDGSCPAGQIKEVTGGKADAAKQLNRTRRCMTKN